MGAAVAEDLHASSCDEAQRRTTRSDEGHKAHGAYLIGTSLFMTGGVLHRMPSALAPLLPVVGEVLDVVQAVEAVEYHIMGNGSRDNSCAGEAVVKSDTECSSAVAWLGPLSSLTEQLWASLDPDVFAPGKASPQTAAQRASASGCNHRLDAADSERSLCAAFCNPRPTPPKAAAPRLLHFSASLSKLSDNQTPV